MGVAHFWKRVHRTALDGRQPEHLADLVPYWFDVEYPAERDAGVLVGLQDTGDLVGTLLDFGAVGTGHEAAAGIVSGRPVNWDQEWMVGTIGVGDVRRAAAFLVDAQLEPWAARHHGALAAEAESLGYHRPFDETWSAEVVGAAERLSALFVAAAANDEAVIVRVSV